jgi:hypothetical protein
VCERNKEREKERERERERPFDRDGIREDKEEVNYYRSHE